MSEYIERNEFGPILVSVTSFQPGHVSINFESRKPTLTIVDCPADDGSTTSVSFEGMRLMDLSRNAI
jgi:hypothetical protein